MRQSLKDLAIAGGIPLEKVQSLVDMVGDEAWIESILRGATKAEKAAMLAGVAYKADDTAGGSSFDDYASQRLARLAAEGKAQLMKEYLSSKAAPEDSGGDDTGELDPLDLAYIQLRDALEAGDAAGVQQALAQLAELAQSPPPSSSTPKARVLTDSGDQSVLPSTKAYIDPLLAALIGTPPAAIKAYDAKVDLWAAAWNADQVTR